MSFDAPAGPTLEISKQIHAEKYRSEGESFREAMNRIASTLKDSDAHYRAFRDILLDQRFLPAGRVQSAIGATRAVTGFNCFVSMTIEDSMDSIMAALAEAASTMRLGGGIGYDFSRIRPRGSRIKSLDSIASGPVSFMEIFDALCGTISSAGHRRGAQMGVLRCDHPDIEEFVHAKQNSSRLRNFNISVGVTDVFMEAVKLGGTFDLMFDGEIYKTIQARPLWEQIMRSNWDWAEPGVLFIDRMNEMNNLWYCETLEATNPCVIGETLILTDEGHVPISKIVDTIANVWNGFEWSSVIPKKTGVDRPLVTVTLSNGATIDCTPNHKFVLKDGARVEAANLQEGAKLMRCQWPVVPGRDRIPVTTAYTQGFFAGDGWYAENGRRAYIGLYGEKKALIHHLTYETAAEYDIAGGYEGTDLTETRVYLRLDPEKMRSRDFVPGTAWDVQGRLSWFAGLCDSDGTMTADGSLQISSKDFNFLDQTRLMLQTLGTQSIVRPMKDIFRLTVSPWYARHLLHLGIPTRRLDFSRAQPDRNCEDFIKVESVRDYGNKADVFCFTEGLRHMGIFNGTLTGQCGEQPLPPHGACLLGSFNLVKYVRTDLAGKRYLDWNLLDDDIPSVVRAMDNVTDRTIYPLPQQAAEATGKRRMGLGYTGLANTAEALGHRYGSPEFMEFHEKIAKRIFNMCYASSALLAQEKGAFPLYDPDKYLQSETVDKLDPGVRDLIVKYGIRNSHLTSVAPTGTISLTADNVSSGIEPVFAYSTDRRIRTVEGEVVERVEDYGYRTWGVKGKLADECTADDHLNALIVASRWVDSAVSKTCNVSPDMPWEDFKDIYMRAWEAGCKGCTTFNAGGKRMGILVKVDDASESVGAACVIDETGNRSCEA